MPKPLSAKPAKAMASDRQNTDRNLLHPTRVTRNSEIAGPTIPETNGTCSFIDLQSGGGEFCINISKKTNKKTDK